METVFIPIHTNIVWWSWCRKNEENAYLNFDLKLGYSIEILRIVVNLSK
jgi:hypothetical protein